MSNLKIPQFPQPFPSNLLRRNNKVHDFHRVPHLTNKIIHKQAIRSGGQQQEHPNVHEDHQENLEHQLPEQEFPQKQRSIDHDQDELDDQHGHKRTRHLVFFEIGCHTSWTLIRAEGGIAEDQNDETCDVAYEHWSIDVDGEFVFGVEETHEEGSNSAILRFDS